MQRSLTAPLLTKFNAKYQFMGKTFTIQDLQAAEKAVSQDPKYGQEERLLEAVLNMHPLNDDINWIAAKVSVIDLTNSTQMSKYKSVLSLYDISKILLNLKIDEDIKSGNIDVVSKIARKCKDFGGKDQGVNLFSFASKYCCYHNVYVYKRDDFSIFDNVVSLHLYEYATPNNPLTKTGPNNWRISIDYTAYNNYIGNLLDERGICDPLRRRMFDHFVWYWNKNTDYSNE